MEKDDAALVALAVEGDESAYQILVEKYQSYVLSIVLKRVSDRDCAEDLVQETLIAAYLSLANLENPSRFRSWIATIAVNLCRMWWRNRHPQCWSIEANDELEIGQHDSAFPADIVVELSLRQETDRLLEVLSDKVRQALLLHCEHGWSYKEIAQTTGVSLSTVRNRVHHGRSLLKRELIGMGDNSGSPFDLPEGFSGQVIKEAVARGEKLKWDFSVFKHNINTSDSVMADQWHARIDGKDLLIRKARSERNFECEKREYLSKAFYRLGQLEGIYLKRSEDFGSLARYFDDRPDPEELKTLAKQSMERLLADCCSLGVLAGASAESEDLSQLWVDVLLEVFCENEREKPGIFWIYPFNLVMYRGELIFTGIFSSIFSSSPECRLLYFCSQPTISRGARYRLRLDEGLVDQFLAGYGEYSNSLEKTSFCRALDAFHTFRFVEGLGGLFYQMENVQNDRRFVELAETYGSFDQRARDMVDSYLGTEMISNSPTVARAQQMLRTLRVHATR